VRASPATCTAQKIRNCARCTALACERDELQDIIQACDQELAFAKALIHIQQQELSRAEIFRREVIETFN
jgi:hypothetical protein